ncbi:uncharacterized protein L969DRAFT_51490, partial [Mixia osmundae IAM 14324]|uniref:uncharacterized protein n=1 Tax=Mixia osmundae (strain CBS 9802 / IAM 14324 / JCM 22182 / KY 12970) TaxID=764103 RepID=UPI0004A55071
QGFRHNNVLHGNHFRKDWQERVRTWFDQAGRKHSRRAARKEKAAKTAPRPLQLLRPAVRCTTVRYNMRIRQGRGFSLEELKTAGVNRKEALSIGIPVDHRRRNRSEESLKRNVERLTAYKERLIVLPRKHSGKKAKKVEKPSIVCFSREARAILRRSYLCHPALPQRSHEPSPARRRNSMLTRPFAMLALPSASQARSQLVQQRRQRRTRPRRNSRLATGSIYAHPVTLVPCKAGARQRAQAHSQQDLDRQRRPRY